MKLKNINRIIFNNIFLDIVFILGIILFLKIMQPDLRIISYKSEEYRSIYSFTRFLWVCSPLIFVYLLLKFITKNSFFSFICTITCLLGLYFANTQKIAFLSVPLIASDLTEFQNFSIALKYLDISYIFLFIFLLVLLFFSWKIGVWLKRKSNGNYYFFSIWLVPFFVTAIFSSYPIIPKLQDLGIISTYIQDSYIKSRMSYVDWSSAENIAIVGLPFHLVHTSRLIMPNEPTTDEEKLFKQLLDKQKKHADLKNINTIIFILCESCWYNESYFKKNIKPILDMGFKEARGISSQYGGGTANSEFEILSGLPADRKFTQGVLFQEYPSKIRENSFLLPYFLKKQGYKNYAAHNNIKSFYNRHIIYPKFGFDRFDSVEVMGDIEPSLLVERQDWQWQKDDSLLFNKAIQYLRDNQDQKNFMHLLTIGTHGAYPEIDGDLGEFAYEYQLNESMNRMYSFLLEVEKIDPNALIFIYSDHKPSLTAFFYQKRILPKSVFTKTGVKNSDFVFNSDVMSREIKGDVPLLLKGPRITTEVLDLMDGKPLYCLPVILDKTIFHLNMPVSQLTGEHCLKNKTELTLDEMAEESPSWLYHKMLF